MLGLATSASQSSPARAYILHRISGQVSSLKLPIVTATAGQWGTTLVCVRAERTSGEGLFVVGQNALGDPFGDDLRGKETVDRLFHCHHAVFLAGFDDTAQEEAAFSADDVPRSAGDHEYLGRDALFAVNGRDQFLVDRTLE